MKTIRNYILYPLISAILLLSNFLPAQNNCYTPLMEQGKAALEANNYEEAIRSFQSILRNCDNLTEGQRSEAIKMTNQAFETNKAAILEAQNARFETEQELSRQRIRASEETAKLKEQDYLKSESSRISFLSSIEPDNADQLSLAYISKKLIDSARVFSQATATAFGDAVRNNYVDIRQSDDGYINAVLLTPARHLVYGIKGNILIIEAQQANKLIKGHEDHILAIIPFRDGFITTSKDHSAKIWDVNGKLLNSLQGHQDDVNFVSVSPNGAYLLTGSRDHTAILWDNTGKRITTLSGHEGNIYEGLFSSSSERIITRSGDHTVKIWDLSGAHIATLKHDSYLYDVLLTPDGQRIITCSADQTIKIWDTNGQLITSKQEHQSQIFGLELSSDGKYFLSTSADRSAILWKTDGTLIKKFQSAYSDLPPEEDPNALAPIRKAFFSPVNELILTSFRNKMQLINFEGEVLANFEHDAPITQLVFAPDGKYLLSGAQDNTAKLWDLEGHILLNLNPFRDHIVGLNFSADGNYALAYSRDGMLAFCPTPGYAYTLLEQDPPEVSEELKIKYNLQLSNDNGN